MNHNINFLNKYVVPAVCSLIYIGSLLVMYAGGVLVYFNKELITGGFMVGAGGAVILVTIWVEKKIKRALIKKRLDNIPTH